LRENVAAPGHQLSTEDPRFGLWSVINAAQRVAPMCRYQSKTRGTYTSIEGESSSRFGTKKAAKPLV
jgi:hypothetical protein